MSTILTVANRIMQLNLEKEVPAIIDRTKEEILAKNREQLLEGRKKDGTELTPSYLNDPYFKTREAAQRYSNWKDKITPNNKRRSGTPNLFIIGSFHNSIKIEVKGDVFDIYSTYPEAGDIENKYTEQIYGLNKENKTAYIAETFFPRLKTYIESTTKLKLT